LVIVLSHFIAYILSGKHGHEGGSGVVLPDVYRRFDWGDAHKPILWLVSFMGCLSVFDVQRSPNPIGVCSECVFRRNPLSVYRFLL